MLNVLSVKSVLDNLASLGRLATSQEEYRAFAALETVYETILSAKNADDRHIAPLAQSTARLCCVLGSRAPPLRKLLQEKLGRTAGCAASQARGERGKEVSESVGALPSRPCSPTGI